MRRLAAIRLVGTALPLLGVSFAAASHYDVRKNDVIPVRFDTELSTNSNQAGDRFTATVERGGLLPEGTRFDGHVVKVGHKTDRHAASLDLAFDDVLLPDGTRQDITGVPIPLSDKYVDKDRDGHYVAKAAVDKNTAVGIGALGGLIVGAILHKPFEGAFVGTLAGILVASTAGNDDQVLVLKKDAEAGVLFKRPVSLDTLNGTSVTDREGTHPPVGGIGLEVKIGNRTARYSADLSPYRVADVTMVPIEETAKQLGFRFEESETSIFVESDDHSLRFEENSASYRLDGRSDQLPTALAKRNGVWYAPADAFARAVGR